MLAAKVALDDQWRFPQYSENPEKLFVCVKEFEDSYFHFHPGFNPISLIKAFYLNIKEGKIVRGGSTITMQVVRMSRQKGKRNYWQKILEILGAVQLELKMSKRKIFHHWCQLAPFGGNVIGAETAAWRYYGRDLHQLSWAETATLAVLPNAPALIHPGKNREELLIKRNALLRKLAKKNYFDSSELKLYLAEEIPDRPVLIPIQGLHLLNYLIEKFPDQNIFKSTIDQEINLRIQGLLENQLNALRNDGIKAVSAMVVDSRNRELVAYIGNLSDHEGNFRFLDLNQAPRSYGSLLKPFLYGYALDKSFLLPEELVGDIPTIIDGFQPQNFDKKFRGAVPLNNMINLSLNIPAVRSLNLVGYRAFYDHLANLKLDYLNKGAEHYGLSIILGGGESNLFSLVQAYHGVNGSYHNGDSSFSNFRIEEGEEVRQGNYSLSSFALNHMVKAMSELSRPVSQMGWERLASRRKIAWKTGTSYGFRDAWTIGFDGRYTVGVWTGNEDGESREGLTGINKAAPIFFDIMNSLTDSEEIGKGQEFEKHIEICSDSGKKAGPLCITKERISVDRLSERWKVCNYHVAGKHTEDGFWKPQSCLKSDEPRDTIFQLPSLISHYYKKENPNYFLLPSIHQECIGESEANLIDFIYPRPQSNIVLPVESNGERRQLIAELSCGLESEVVFWFLDGRYLDQTAGQEHLLNMLPQPGEHELQVVGKSGIRKKLIFNVVWP